MVMFVSCKSTSKNYLGVKPFKLACSASPFIVSQIVGMWRILPGLVGLVISFKLSFMKPVSFLSVLSRFLISGYTLLLLTSLLMFKRESFLRSVLNQLSVGFPMPEKDYGDVCQIYTPDHPSGDPFFNVTDRVDVFVLAHSLGWFVKALIVRDLRVSWICSVLFEVIEVAFAHLLPNFNECWWDSIIMDIFGCNLLGIHLADLALTYLGWEKFDFFKRGFPLSKGRLNFKFIFSASLLVALITLIDLNFFFMKFVLLIPTTHWTSHVRTYSFALISAPASFEMFKWASKRSTKSRMSFFTDCPSAVIGIVALLTEIAVYSLFRGDMFAKSPSTPLGTLVLIVSLAYVPIYAFVKIRAVNK